MRLREEIRRIQEKYDELECRQSSVAAIDRVAGVKSEVANRANVRPEPGGQDAEHERPAASDSNAGLAVSDTAVDGIASRTILPSSSTSAPDDRELKTKMLPNDFKRVTKSGANAEDDESRSYLPEDYGLLVPLREGSPSSASGSEIRETNQSQRPKHCEKSSKDVRAERVPRQAVRHRNRTYSCFDCGKVFASLQYLKVHSRRHTGEKPYSCSQCDKTFSQVSNLVSHRRIHTGDKSFSCRVCDKAFTQMGNLVTHIRIHTGEKPYPCSQCDKAFPQLANLLAHRRIHTGEKPYPCDVCGKRFAQSGGLTAHSRTHSKNRSYSCHICGKRFRRSDVLERHIQLHPQSKVYDCEFCGKRFKKKTNIIYHLRKACNER